MKSTIKPNQGLLSIEIKPTGAAVAYSPNPDTKNISFCELKEYENNLETDTCEFKEHISKLVLKHHLKKNNCNLVLHPDFYRLTLVDTPNVPRAEYKKAIRWQIKDIISYPLEDVAIDIFNPGETEENTKKIYVIAAQKSFLQKIVNVVQDCGLYPIAVDIREFAVRNLIAELAKPSETIGFLNLTDDGCILILIKERHVQFVRHFPIKLDFLKNNNYSGLITELQRSFDYCQTELDQELPERIFIPPTMDIDNTITQNIEKSLQKETSIFNLRDIVNLETSIDKQAESDCWSAIGGTLRNNE